MTLGQSLYRFALVGPVEECALPTEEYLKVFMLPLLTPQDFGNKC